MAQLTCCYVDRDFYNCAEHQGRAPEAVLTAVLAHLDQAGVPEPSLVVFSGRGLVVLWAVAPQPSQALPRWTAIQRQLTTLLERFGADRHAADAARVFRIVGNVNGKSGLPVRVLHEGPGTASRRWPRPCCRSAVRRPRPSGQ